MSNDNSLLVTGNYDDKTYVYYRENTTFSLNQTIANSGDDVMVTDITSDGQVLLEVGKNALIRVY